MCTKSFFLHLPAIHPSISVLNGTRRKLIDLIQEFVFVLQSAETLVKRVLCMQLRTKERNGEREKTRKIMFLDEIIFLILICHQSIFRHPLICQQFIFISLFISFLIPFLLKLNLCFSPPLPPFPPTQHFHYFASFLVQIKKFVETNLRKIKIKLYKSGCWKVA